MATSVVTRAMKIIYGGVTCGTGSVFQITNVHVLEKSYEAISVSFDVLVQNTVLATFLANCATLEAAYRTKNSDLRIVLGGSDHTNLTHANDTGFNGRASIVKAGHPADSNASRVYTCSAAAELPADEAGKNARRDSGYRLTSDAAGLQTLEVRAVYTATGGTDALTQAKAQFPGYASGLQPSVTGAWDDAAAAVYSPDDENKVCECFISYQELTHAQSSSGTNDSSIVGDSITIFTQRTSAASDRGSNAKPLVTVQVVYSAAVPISSSTDLKGKWEALRVYLKSVAEEQSGVSNLTVIDENPSPEPTKNRLSGTLTLAGADGSSLLLSQTLVGTAETTGKQFAPVANGDPLGADVHDGPQTHTAVVQSTILELDQGATEASFAAFDAAVSALKGDGYEETLREQPLDIRFEHTGQLFSSGLSLRRRQKRVTLRRVNRANAEQAPSGGFRSAVRGGAGRWALDQT